MDGWMDKWISELGGDSISDMLLLFVLLHPVPYRINKPGGCAKVIKVHFTEDGANIEALDVKYVLSGGNEKKIDPAIVSRFEVLEPRGRKRRGRDFLMEQADNVVKTITGKKAEANKHKGAITEKPSQKKKQTKLKRQPQKEPEPSPQSTSPSTPVTPEHPSSRPPKVKKMTPVVKKMTPVPSYVLAGGIVEVSPLPLGHRSSKKSTKKPAVARRGLFGSSEPTKVVVKTKTNKVAVAESKPAAARTKSAKVDDKKPLWVAALSLKTNKSQADSKKPAKKEIIVRPLSMNTERRRPMSTQVRKSASNPILSLPRPKSAKQHPEGSQKPLKACFDYEVKKAREFLDEVCGARADDVVDSSANENRPLNSKPAASS
jgi:hypothetical protein